MDHATAVRNSVSLLRSMDSHISHPVLTIHRATDSYRKWWTLQRTHWNDVRHQVKIQNLPSCSFERRQSPITYLLLLNCCRKDLYVLHSPHVSSSIWNMRTCGKFFSNDSRPRKGTSTVDHVNWVKWKLVNLSRYRHRTYPGNQLLWFLQPRNHVHTSYKQRMVRDIAATGSSCVRCPPSWLTR